MHRTQLADRLLAEWTRRAEEDTGHPQHCSDADEAAVRAGGDLTQRIVVRARALPGAQARLRAIRRVLRFAAGLAMALILLATLSGIATASAALGATTPASLPLVLLAVVGTNLLMLLLWVIAQLLGSRIAPGIGSLLRLLSTLHARRMRADGDDTPSILRAIADGALGRWFAAAVVHAAWLGFALGAVLALAILLSVRAYELSWATTLLSDRALGTWAHLLSVGPALAGIVGAETLPVNDLSAAAVRQAWSWWLLAAATIYGVLPRALALLSSLLMLWRAQRALASDLSRPGFARLRARLLPDHAALGVVDPAPPVKPQPPQPARPAAAPLRGRVHGLTLAAPDRVTPPSLPEVQWVWLGDVDDAATRAEMLRRLRDEPVDALAICVRATLTPDRGIERYVSEMAVAAGAPTTLLLGDIDRLQARGAEASAQRLQDWQSLAQRAGTHLLSEPEAPA